MPPQRYIRLLVDVCGNETHLASLKQRFIPRSTSNAQVMLTLQSRYRSIRLSSGRQFANDKDINAICKTIFRIVISKFHYFFYVTDKELAIVKLQAWCQMDSVNAR